MEQKERKEFSSLPIGHLSLDNLLGYNSALIGIGAASRNSLGVLPEAALSLLEEATAELDNRLNHPLGSMITPELTQLDVQRDKIINEIKRDVKTASKSSDETKSAAGAILMNFLIPYWDTDKKVLNTESSLISELIGRYGNDPALTAGAITIGIDTLFTKLNIVNTDFDKLYLQRNAETKDAAASKIKYAVVRRSEDFVILIEQAVNLTPSDEFNALFDQIGNLRKKYNALFPQNPPKIEDVKE
jgi:hypothetical protein